MGRWKGEGRHGENYKGGGEEENANNERTSIVNALNILVLCVHQAVYLGDLHWGDVL